MKTKKIFIALLATLCIGATSAGLIACGGNPDKDKPGPDTTDDPGKNPGDTDNPDGGKQEDPVITAGFSIKAVDSNNYPVANAYFNIGFYDDSSASDSFITSDGKITSAYSKAALIKTNENGFASLEIEIDEDRDYKLYLADPAYISATGTIPAVPNGYSTNFGMNQYGFPSSTVDFEKVDDGLYSAKANFILDNSWGSLFDPTHDLVYRRYYPDYYQDKLVVNYTPYAKNVKTGQLNYFTFAPYFAPMPDTEDQDIIAAASAKGRQAASGIYRISWTASDPSADVLLNLYSFNGGNYFQSNADGSPTETYVLMHTGNAPTDETTLKAAYEKYKWLDDTISYEAWLANYNASFSGKNYITLDLSSDTSTTVYNFGYISSANCKVTIEVDRIADAAIWTDEEVIKEIPENEPEASKEEGSVINVPLTLNTVVVKGDDGYYHLGSKDGAIVYVQLKNSTRVNAMSMEKLADSTNTDGRAQFVITEDKFDEATNTGVHYYYNYGNVVLGYAALANSDGLYPVNDLLKTVLEAFCKTMMNYTQYGERYWLAACQYYGAVPDGTEDRPYYLTDGTSSITLTDGSAWVVFVPSSTGYYEFNYNVPGSVLAKDSYFISLEAQEEFKFKVEGTGATLSLTVSLIDGTPRHLRYYGSDVENGQVWHGTEQMPLSLSYLYVYMVTIDHNTYNSPITIDIQFMLELLNGNYVIHVAGSSNCSIKVKVENGYVVYDDSALALSSTQSTRIQLDSTQDETFFIWLEKVA